MSQVRLLALDAKGVEARAIPPLGVTKARVLILVFFFIELKGRDGTFFFSGVGCGAGLGPKPRNCQDESRQEQRLSAGPDRAGHRRQWAFGE